MANDRYRPCPNCGLMNIRERRICKRCRHDMALALVATPPAATGHTGHFYQAVASNETLFIVPEYLEYVGPVVTLRTLWPNAIAFHRSRNAIALQLAHAAAVRAVIDATTPLDDPLFRTIPLSPFGFPHNAALREDLIRYLPHLSVRDVR